MVNEEVPFSEARSLTLDEELGKPVSEGPKVQPGKKETAEQLKAAAVAAGFTDAAVEDGRGRVRGARLHDGGDVGVLRRASCPLLPARYQEQRAAPGSSRLQVDDLLPARFQRAASRKTLNSS